MEISVRTLNAGRATSDLERRIVAEALRIVAHRASTERRPLPAKLPYLDVRLPYALARVEQGYVTERAAAGALAERLWAKLLPEVTADAQQVRKFCGLCFSSVPWSAQPCPFCGGDRAKGEQLRAAKLALEQAKAQGTVAPVSFRPGLVYQLQLGDDGYQGQIVEDAPDHVMLWAGRAIALPKSGIAATSIREVWRPPHLAAGTWIQIDTLPPIGGVSGMPAHQRLRGEVTACSGDTLTVAGQQVPTRFLNWYSFQVIEAPAQRPAPRAQQPLVDAQTAVQQGGFYMGDRIFRDWISESYERMPDEGWKLHVSASAEDAGEVAAVCLPVLRALGVTHKVVGDVEQYVTVMTGTQLGKFITIYPETPQQARAIVDRLDPLLSGLALRGPQVPEEMPLGRSGLIFARYGGFKKSTVTGPDGREVPDERGRIRPPWVADPFA